MNTTSKKRRWLAGQILVILIFIGATAASIILGLWLNASSREVKKYKKEFFTANQLKYGFLNGEQWSHQVERIIEAKIDSFSFSDKNIAVMKEQVSGVMNELVDQVDIMLDERQEKLTDRVKMSAIRWFVDLEKVRAKIPHFADVVVHEVEKSGNKAKVRDMVKEKVHDLLIGHDHRVSPQERILRHHNCSSLAEFNRRMQQKTAHIEEVQRVWGYQLVGIMGLLLVFWWILLRLRFREVYAVAFLFSVLISFVNLYTGINLPMLEIDARISTLDLELLGSHVQFYDQVLFYQSKSIIEVATILMTKGKVGSIVVGVLILLFSVLFPAAKLIATTIYLYSKKKKSQLVSVLAFKSGKWSMADVMVVAIFIAYIGFQSIINEQLDHISTRAGETEEVNILTTNRSNLQIGFVIFLSFVLFNMILAMILKRITEEKETRFRFIQWWQENRWLHRETRIARNAQESDGTQLPTPEPPEDKPDDA
jgi:hypothetical protein